ncbi:hypothetical protein L211DRAFT_409588 [Terfezia boudieri ATCC MYA-4762]|uniref:Uncharacterized protein n=1 Tax=Terfezia boudieri ATCC MYA-4762 TaxID=1051890 RepID=A0A3N4LGM7_9PEZI|nr:hypothetical protein L211DRAFT_409588 [Terfezia boudieri ATCC MYA-4762]
MLLLQYIDELQGNKYSNISHENGGCPPLQLDFLRRRTNQTRPSIGVLEDKKCSTTTKKNSDNPPLKPEIAPLVCVLLALTLIVVVNLTIPIGNSKQINALSPWRIMTIVLLPFLQRYMPIYL